MSDLFSYPQFWIFLALIGACCAVGTMLTVASVLNLQWPTLGPRGMNGATTPSSRIIRFGLGMVSFGFPMMFLSGPAERGAVWAWIAIATWGISTLAAMVLLCLADWKRRSEPRAK